jgi:hypothetical protein
LSNHSIVISTVLDGKVPETSQALASGDYAAALYSNRDITFEEREFWNISLHQSENTNLVFQTPRYVEFLEETIDTNSPKIAVIRNNANGLCVGISPIVRSRIYIRFYARSSDVIRVPLDSIIVLGGEPSLLDDDEVFSLFFELIRSKYPSCQSISMNLVSIDSALWRYISRSSLIKKNFYVYVMNGFSDCHMVRVPQTLEDYHAILSKKKRYNLARQERLLETAMGGKLILNRIEKQEDIGLLVSAINKFTESKTDDSILSIDEYYAACRKGILLCYTMTINSTIIGLAIGTKSDTTYLLHRFFYIKSLRKYSIGTTLWQKVYVDLIENQDFCLVDMGYGSPSARYASTNLIKTRGHVLLLRKCLSNLILVKLHVLFNNIKGYVKKRKTHASLAL